MANLWQPGDEVGEYEFVGEYGTSFLDDNIYNSMSGVRYYSPSKQEKWICTCFTPTHPNSLDMIVTYRKK
jgi:hypothetical protein